jgi:hypothetical protein
MITTAEETAALAANEALPERIIDGRREGPLRRPVKPKQAEDLPGALE